MKTLSEETPGLIFFLLGYPEEIFVLELVLRFSEV